MSAGGGACCRARCQLTFYDSFGQGFSAGGTGARTPLECRSSQETDSVLLRSIVGWMKLADFAREQCFNGIGAKPTRRDVAESERPLSGY